MQLGLCEFMINHKKKKSLDYAISVCMSVTQLPVLFICFCECNLIKLNKKTLRHERRLSLSFVWSVIKNIFLEILSPMKLVWFYLTISLVRPSKESQPFQRSLIELSFISIWTKPRILKIDVTSCRLYLIRQIYNTYLVF